MNAHPEQRIRVAVLFGGQSSEHAVSCVTAQSVIKAMDTSKYQVIPIGITQRGQWTLADLSSGQFSLSAGNELPSVPAAEANAELVKHAETTQLVKVQPGSAAQELGQLDVVFPLLHGPFGEDGSVQGLLELLEIPYVGSGVLASAMGMDKHFMKVAFAAAGLQVGPYVVITDKAYHADLPACLAKVSAELQFPVFVKPARAGSSMGITKVDSPAELTEAIELARDHDPKVIVEQGITGREIEVGVLDAVGTAPVRTTMPGEIDVSVGEHEFYDFEAKYVQGGQAELSCPANLPEEVIALVREQAGRAFEAIGAEGLSRVDFFYSPEGELIINEINTMPGFTPISMYPQMWAQSGLSYESLIDELISLALARKTGLR